MSKVKSKKINNSNNPNFQAFKLLHVYIFLIFQGFIVFFPYLIGARWREGRPNSLLTGRKLTSLVDMFVEEKRRGHVISPEYLSKSPCGFEVTELVLKQILVCCAETKRQLLGKDIYFNILKVKSLKFR